MNFSISLNTTFTYAIEPSGVIAFCIFGIVGVVAYALHSHYAKKAKHSQNIEHQ